VGGAQWQRLFAQSPMFFYHRESRERKAGRPELSALSQAGREPMVVEILYAFCAFFEVTARLNPSNRAIERMTGRRACPGCIRTPLARSMLSLTLVVISQQFLHPALFDTAK
jgi:hypothetical protein